jgi:hypothetical protein
MGCAIAVALCSGCAASQARYHDYYHYHYSYSLSGGTMRSLPTIDHHREHDDKRQASQ